MSFRKRMPAVAAGAFLALSPVVAAQPASALTAEEQYLVDSVNAARAAQGLAPLTHSEQLSVLADRHSLEMSEAGSLFHSASLGASVGAVYPSWTRVGENVGRGSSIEDINAALLASPEHAANIYGDFNLLGVGVYTNPGGVMWVTELFAKAVEDSAVTATAPVAPATSAVVPVETPTATTTATASGTGGGGSGKPDRAARSSASARRASAPASSMGAARGARGASRQGPPEWAQNERSGR